MTKIVLLRHGESTWNKENRFTGWTDVDLTEQGRAEAKRAGSLLKAEGFTFDSAFTSVLKRAIRTLWSVLDELDRMWIPIEHSWRLNERHYGALQGLNKAETAAKFGDQQVLVWRRSYDIPPPPLEKNDPRYAADDPRYQHLKPGELPLTECLKDTVDRFLPYWHERIAPAVQAGKKVIIAAHGNSLRALVKYLDNVSDQAIVELNIPTGVPLVYELDKGLKPLQHYYLGDPEEIARAAQAVAQQGKARWQTFEREVHSIAVRVKICGITSPADASAAVEAGADAIGLNLYAQSPRFVSEERAAVILRALPAFVDPVILFVQESFEPLAATCYRLGCVRTVQLHGDYPSPLPALPFRFVPAFAVKDETSLTHIRHFVERCEKAERPPAAVLVDAHVPGEFGGTGKNAPWHLLAGFDAGVPLILAGGLTPDNVAAAIKIVKPYAVDVASGVESSPGVKDPEKMRKFVERARGA